MKFRHSLIIGCLTALLGFGAFLGAGANREAKVEKAEAATYALPTSDGNLLIRLYNNSWTSGSKTAVRFYDNSSNECWSSIISDEHKYQANGDGSVDYFVYPTDTSHSWTQIIIVRLNGDATVPDWSKKWNQTSKFALSSSYNCYGPHDPNGDTTGKNDIKLTISHTLDSGSSFYIDKNGYDFLQDNHILGAYFFGSTRQESATKVQFNLVNGFYNGNGTKNNELFEVLVPGNGAYRWVIVYRSTSLGGGWTNQSQDLDASSTKNVYKFNNWDGTMYGLFDWTLTNRSSLFGRYVIDLTDTVCAGYDEKTCPDNSEALAPFFTTTLKTEYNHMNATDKGYFKNAIANKESADYLAKGAARYDYVVAKYGLENFASRTLSYSFGAILVEPTIIDSANTTVIAFVASFSAVVAAAGFVLLKKKKSI